MSSPIEPSSKTSEPIGSGSAGAGWSSGDSFQQPLHRFDHSHPRPGEKRSVSGLEMPSGGPVLSRQPESLRQPVSSVSPNAGDLHGNASRIGPSAEAQTASAPEDLPILDPSTIRNAHAENLIEYLQAWSEELDERAARLHADIATHERRERAFRLWMQNRRNEIEAQLAQYNAAQAQLAAQARRLAVVNAT